MRQPDKKLFVINPRGFCAGVDRAIDIVSLTLEIYGTPLYVKHAIVHNTHVVKRFEKQGVTFTDDIQAIPEGSRVVFSAHGSSLQDFALARERRLKIIDATCPLVTKVHLEVERFSRLGYDIVMIGHRGHVEPKGTLGHAKNVVTHLVETKNDVNELVVRNPEKVAIVTQTTLSLDETKETLEALREKFPKAETPHKEDICYATTNRQTAVKQALPFIDRLIVVGSRESSNSNRLRELGERAGKPSFLIDDQTDLTPSMYSEVASLGLTSGASAPEDIVQEVAKKLAQEGFVPSVIPQQRSEEVHFALPVDLVKQAKEKESGSDLVSKHKIEKGQKMKI